MVAHACRAFSACMSVQERSEAAVCHIAPGAKSCSVRIPAWNTWRGPFKRDYPTLPVGTGSRIGLSTPELSPRWGSRFFRGSPSGKKLHIPRKSCYREELHPRVALLHRLSATVHHCSERSSKRVCLLHQIYARREVSGDACRCQVNVLVSCRLGWQPTT